MLRSAQSNMVCVMIVPSICGKHIVLVVAGTANVLGEPSDRYKDIKHGCVHDEEEPGRYSYLKRLPECWLAPSLVALHTAVLHEAIVVLRASMTVEVQLLCTRMRSNARCDVVACL